MDACDPDQSDPLTGHVVLGRLTLPRSVYDVVVARAAAEGLTPLQLVRRWVADRAHGQP